MIEGGDEMICDKCRTREKVDHNGCKVCGYKNRNNKKIISIMENGKWVEGELDVILENILYRKIEVVNELEKLLSGKTLEDIIGLIKLLKIGGRTPIRVKLKCFICGEEMIRPVSHFYKDRVYCSYECRDRYKTMYLSGESSMWYKRIHTACTNCEKPLEVIPYYYNLQNENGDNHNFCSKECYFEYRSKYYIKDKHPMFGAHQTEENKQRAKQRIAQIIADGKMPQTMTKPHKIIYDMLIFQGIECKNEYVLKYHSVDIYLNQYNLMIEIMGDYWHGIPLKYTYKDLNKQQLKSIKQDKSKHTYAKKYHNVEILYLWERDINNNLELCLALIREYINKQGILEDYNSYNYDIIDQYLQLKEEIISPYFITQNPYRLQEVDGNINLEVVLPTPLLEGNNIQSALTL